MSRSLAWFLVLPLLTASFALAQRGPASPPRGVAIEPAAPAPAAAPKGRFCALLVGVDRYADPEISPLQFCTRDVQVLEQVLTSSGYDARDLYVLRTGGDEEPSKQNIMRRLENLLKRAGANDTIFIFFSGHGWLDRDGKAYLVAGDTQLGDVAGTAVAVQGLRELLAASPAKNKCLALDCCHAGGKDAQGFGATPEEVGSPLGKVNNVLTLASCKARQKSYEWPEKKQGIFATFLAEGLRGEADANQDSCVSTLELAAYVARTKAQASTLHYTQEPAVIIAGNEVPQFDIALVPNRRIRQYTLRLLDNQRPPQPSRLQDWKLDPAIAVLSKPAGWSVYPQKGGRVTMEREGILLEEGSYVEWTVYLGGWGAETNLTLEGKEGTPSESFVVWRPQGNVPCRARLAGFPDLEVGATFSFQRSCRMEWTKGELVFKVEGEVLHKKRMDPESAFHAMTIELATPKNVWGGNQNTSLLGLRFGRN